MYRIQILVLSWLAASAALAEVVPFDSPRWRISAEQAEVTGSGAEAVLAVVGGGALLEGVEVENAEVRFEVMFGPQRGFMGLEFRVEDEQNYEHFYIRPHQSGQPDANQYTPVYSGVSAWQLYHGPAYSVPLTYVPDEWIEIRVVFHGKRAEVFFGKDDTPVLAIPELKRTVAPGSLGVSTNFAPAKFRNFRWREIEEWSWTGEAAELPEAPAGVIGSFEVSGSFMESSLDQEWTLPANLTDRLEWKTATTEKSGLLNLASVANRGEDRTKNTVLARHRLHVDRDSVVVWTFGFSDRVRVYCDGRLAYAGSDLYRSRDFRFLGTIGLFDTVVCSLDKGDHDVVFAVSESFGGWGILATETVH